LSAEQPRTIGRYEVERLLGQGGMGRVWLARDTVLGRRVAIKVLRDDLALPPTVRDELIVRMGHEARAAAAVSHPNIVTLYDMGEDPKLGLYLVFEYVTTSEKPYETAASAPASKDESSVIVDMPTSLRDRLKLGPIPWTEVAKLARELGSALTFAHGAGVIHRDIKPENILFSRNGSKIADFGIARIPDSTITRANTVLGTPAYTAPEALSKGEFSPASDQFSLAATLYEAATGARAFAGEDAIVTAGKVSSEPPPPLHESLGPEPAVKALDVVLQRGLSKAPEDRFASCMDLGNEVARAIQEESRRPSPSARGGGSLLTPIPGLAGVLELERTPLSSRVALVQRAISEHPSGVSSETPRPSIFLRKRTHRFQNIAAALALITIVVLVLLGRRTPPAANDAADAGASAAGAASTGLPQTSATHSAHPKTPKPKSNGSGTSANVRPSPSASSEAPADAGGARTPDGDGDE